MTSFEREDIVDWVRTKGPCTGLEIKKEIDIDSLILWKACKTSPELQVRTVGRRYLRLDRHVEGFARLSPSILREFLTYSVIGLANDPDLLEKRCAEVANRIREISRFKFEFARQMVSEVMEEFGDEASRDHPISFVIAGDVVYDMAHDVPRPERSTGRLVMGSDIDLVVVVDESLPDSSISTLDMLIHRKKYRMLIDPAIKEEVDYKIKRLGRIRDQARFDDFKDMVAVKILQEGLLLFGSETLYQTIQTIVRGNGLAERLDELERLARLSREKAEQSILNNQLDHTAIMETHLFYSAEEFEEFE